MVVAERIKIQKSHGAMGTKVMQLTRRDEGGATGNVSGHCRRGFQHGKVKRCVQPEGDHGHGVAMRLEIQSGPDIGGPCAP